MSCNSNKTASKNFTSVAGVIEAIEMATPLSYEYPGSLDLALTEMNDPVMVVPSVRLGIDSLISSIDEYLYPVIIERQLSTNPAEYPSLNDRINGTNGGSVPGKISYTELADFLDYASYVSVPKFNAAVTISPSEVARQLNRYYEEQMSGSAVSLCSLLNNPFANVSALLDMIDGLTSGILNHLPSIASRLQSFAETMKSLTENLFETLKGMVSNLASMAQDVIEGLANAPAALAGISQVFTSQISALRNLLSEDNLANVKEAIDKFVTKAVLQFQKILENPQVLLYLLYMFCKTQSFIESSLQSPVKAFQGMVSNASHEQNVLKVKSAPRTQAAITAGRPTATQEAINEIRAQKAMSHNNAVAANPAEVPDQTQIVYTQERTTHPDPNSWSNLQFSQKVINNPFFITGKGKGKGIDPAIGYYRCELHILERMNKVGQMLGVKLMIHSAYRHPLYNAHVGGARSSYHMKGIALDVGMSNVSDRGEFVRLCKMVGFSRFGGYRDKGFIHADTAKPSLVFKGADYLR